MIEIGLGHYLSLGAIIFFLGVIGIFLNRKNVIVILMSIELILLAVNINLISFSIFSGDILGQIFTMLILTVAAAEAAIGLARQALRFCAFSNHICLVHSHLRWHSLHKWRA